MMHLTRQPEGVPGSADDRGNASSKTDRTRVLVVNDEPAVARVSERVLTRHGFEVTVAYDARDAIAEIRSISFTPL